MNHSPTIRFFAIALFASIALAAPAQAEEVSFVTEDGFTIVGDLHAGPADAPALILLHAYRATARSWGTLIPMLHDAGYTVLVLDQRTHGRSTNQNGKPLRVKQIPIEDFGPTLREGVQDVAGARALLEARGLGGGGLALVGASYGCSVALLSTQSQPGVDALALISPGISYFEVPVKPAIRAFAGPILAIAAEDDANRADRARDLTEAHPGKSELIVYPTGGHGTKLFRGRTEAMDAIVEFLGRVLPR